MCARRAHLEVRLCENSGELRYRVGVRFERVQISEDLLEKLDIVLPYRREPWCLQALILLLTHKYMPF